MLTYNYKQNKNKLERNILKGDTMNNTEHFGKLTERMQAFREEVLDANHILTHREPYWQQKLIKKTRISQELW